MCLNMAGVGVPHLRRREVVIKVVLNCLCARIDTVLGFICLPEWFSPAYFLVRLREDSIGFRVADGETGAKMFSAIAVFNSLQPKCAGFYN